MASSVLEELAAGRSPGVFPLTVEQYRRMVASGILREGEPVELIEGVLVRKDRAVGGGEPSTHGPAHANAVARLERLGRRLEAHGHHLRTQLPIALSDTSEPEPDGSVVGGTPEDFEAQHPSAQDVSLVIEVADSSLEFDRTTKQRLYASAGIPEYWIVNLRQHCVEVYQEPSRDDPRYRELASHEPGESVTLRLGEATLEVAVGELLAPRS